MKIENKDVAVRNLDILGKVNACFKHNGILQKGEPALCGVDLGTASIILVALSGDGVPVASEMECCEVARDGLVVDYMGAIAIVRKLKERIEKRLSAELTYTAIAVPPGTNRRDAGTHGHVVEAAGLEVAAVLDEPTAANAVLGVQNGVVIDIGGGTTGLSVLQDGEVIYTADEATGGTHMSLILMRRYSLSFREAEAFKQDKKSSAEVFAAVRPVAEKMAGIVKRHIAGFDVNEAWLVGGTTCLAGIEDIFSDTLGIKAQKPPHPMMVTPLGIALGCLVARSEESRKEASIC